MLCSQSLFVCSLQLVTHLQEARELAQLQEHFDRVDANATRATAEAASLAAISGRVSRALAILDTAAAAIQVNSSVLHDGLVMSG